MDAPAAAPSPAPLVVTLALDAASQAWLDALRRAHFPPARLLVPAHVTLFHALPGARAAEVRAVLAAAAAETASFDVAFPGLRFLGRGVAVAVEAPPLGAVRARIARAFAPALTRQDAQGFRPHATVQNKVPPDVARATFDVLAAAFAPRTGRAEGLHLWRYVGGPWEAVETVRFAP